MITASEDALLSSIEGAWRSQRKFIGTAVYACDGTTVVLERSIEIPPELAGGNTTLYFPTSDYTFQRSLKWSIDFSTGRFRREARRELFHITERRFVPEVLIDLYNGQEFQQYLPRQETLKLGREGIPEFAPELWERGPERTAMVIRELDLPVFYAAGYVPTDNSGIRIAHGSLQVTLDHSEMSIVSTGVNAGRPTAVLETPHLTEGNVLGYLQYTVDKNPPHLLYQASAFRNHSEITRITIDYDHSVEQPHISPSHWIVTDFSHTGKVSNTDELSVTAATFEQSLPASMFDITPPPGMVVYDQVKGTVFVKGAPGEPDTSVGENQLRLPATDSSWRLVVFVNVVMMLLLSGLLMARHKWSR